MRGIAARLSDPALFCSSAVILLIDQFGTEVLEWEPASIYTELEERFKVKVTGLLADKINAACALLSSDLYHKSLEAFTAVNTAFNLKPVSTTEFSVCTLDDIMWGVTEARLLEGPEIFDAAGFSHDIAGYTAMLLSAEGITKPPAMLKFAEYDPGELDRRGIALAGDPMMAEAYWGRQEDERAKLERGAEETLRALLREVETLPLTNGRAALPPAYAEKL